MQYVSTRGGAPELGFADVLLAGLASDGGLYVPMEYPALPDLAGAPALIDVKQGGKTIPAVAVIGKVGLLFLLDRTTGTPLFAVEDREVPPSEVPLERVAKTQPFPLKPPPLSRRSRRSSKPRAAS